MILSFSFNEVQTHRKVHLHSRVGGNADTLPLCDIPAAKQLSDALETMNFQVVDSIIQIFSTGLTSS